jgi:hypothetical protein
MLKSIFYSNLRIGEFIQFIKQFLAFVQGGDPLALGIQDQYLALEQQWNELQQLFKKVLGSELTEVLEKQDERRDRAISGLRMYFDSFTYHMDPAKSEAARKLLEVIDRYGRGISRKNYQEESAIISGILKDWENDPELSEAITLLNADDWKEELKTANNEFDAVYRDRTSDLISVPEASATEMREPVMDAYRMLVNHLEAHTTLAQDKASYQHLAALLNKHIDQYNQLVISRSRGESESEDIDTGTSGDLDL